MVAVEQIRHGESKRREVEESLRSQLSQSHSILSLIRSQSGVDSRQVQVQADVGNQFFEPRGQDRLPAAGFQNYHDGTEEDAFDNSISRQSC
jgi:hypothetical protein